MKKGILLSCFIGIVQLVSAQQIKLDSLNIGVRGSVEAIAQDGEYLYLGGNFSEAGYYTGPGAVLPLPGEIPEQIFPHVVGSIHAIVEDGAGGWYIGGYLNSIAGHDIGDLAHILPNYELDLSFQPKPEGSVLALVKDEERLYFGGNFTEVDGKPIPRLARMDLQNGSVDESWVPAPDRQVLELMLDGGFLHVGGEFNQIGGMLSQRKYAKFDIATGEVLQTHSFDREIVTFEQNDGYVYAGGWMEEGGFATGGVALNSTLNPKPEFNFPFLNGWVESVIPDGEGGWFIGGGFITTDGEDLGDVVHVFPDMTLDAGFRSNLEGSVYSMALDGDDLYVGGYFQENGSELYKHLVKVNAGTGAVNSDWAPLPDERVYSILVNDDQVYIGGYFNLVGGLVRNFIAAIDKNTGQVSDWAPKVDRQVNTLAKSLNGIILGGNFTSVNDVSEQSYLVELNLDNGEAINVPYNVNGTINSVQTEGNTLYVGGSFSSVAGHSRSNLASITLSNGQLNTFNPPSEAQYINAIAIVGGSIFVGGRSRELGGYLKALDKSTGQLLNWDARPDGIVETIAVQGTSILSGGNFTYLDHFEREGLVRLDQASDKIDRDFVSTDYRVFALQKEGNTLYVGGTFRKIGGIDRNQLASLNLSSGEVTSWNPPGPDGERGILGILPKGDRLYLNGSFFSYDGQERYNLAAIRKSDGQLLPWDPDPGSNVLQVHDLGDKLLVAGLFNFFKVKERENLLQYHMPSRRITDWQPDPDGVVVALLMHGDTIFVGGAFDEIAGQQRGYLAAINVGSGELLSWQANADRRIDHISTHLGKVYVGGSFNQIGGQSRNGLARLQISDGTVDAWNPGVRASDTEVIGHRVFVSGQFSSVNGVYQPSLAAFDIETGELLDWKVPFSGITRTIGLAKMGNELLVHGGFSVRDIPGSPALLGFDPVSAEVTWNPNVAWEVYDLETYDDAVLLGGHFDEVNGTSVSNFAYIDRQTGDLAPGLPTIDRRIDEIHLMDNKLFIGGSFDHVNGKPKSGFAAFVLPGSIEPEECAISALGLGEVICEDNQVRFPVSFIVEDGSGHYEIYNVDTDAVLATWENGSENGEISIDVILDGPTESSVLIVNVRDVQNEDCHGPSNLRVEVPQCPPPACAISDVVVSEMSCSGEGARFLVSFNVVDGSGTYQVIDAGTNEILSSQSGQGTDGAKQMTVVLSGPVEGGTISILVRDSQDAACISDSPPAAILPDCVQEDCSISQVTTEAICEGANVLLTTGFEVMGGSGSYSILYASTSQVLATSINAPAEGHIDIPIMFAGSAQAYSLSLIVRDNSDPTCATEAFQVNIPACVVEIPCSISAFSSGEVTCSGDNAVFDISFEVQEGSGNYKILDESTEEVLLSLQSVANNGMVHGQVVLGGPTTQTELSLTVRDVGVMECISAPLSVTIPECEVVVPEPTAFALDTLPFAINGPVYSVLENEDMLYVGGEFSGAGRPTGGFTSISLPNTFPDHILPQLDGNVYAVIEDGIGGWYVGGGFVHITEDSVQYRDLIHILANNQVDEDFNSLPFNGSIHSLALQDGFLYLGGNFRDHTITTHSNLGRIDLATKLFDPTWRPSANEMVTEMSIDEGKLYVSGYFTRIAGKNQSGFAVLDLTTGESIPAPTFKVIFGSSGYPGSIVQNEESLYLGGGMYATANPAQGIALFSPDSDVPDYGFQSLYQRSDVRSVLPDGNGGWYVGGGTSFMENSRAIHGLLHILPDKSLDTTFQPQPNQHVSAMVLNGEYLYVSGAFTEIGGQAIRGLARIHQPTGTVDTEWTPQMEGYSNVLMVDGDYLFAGGSFTSVGGEMRTNLAKVGLANGEISTWNPSATGTVYDLSPTPRGLLVAGSFVDLQGSDNDFLVEIDKESGRVTGRNYNANGTVRTILPDGNKIYVGGDFTEIGDSSRSRLAAIDLNSAKANEWNPGANSSVYDMVSIASAIYIVGEFTFLGNKLRRSAGAVSKSSGDVLSWDPEPEAYNDFVKHFLKSIATDGNQFVLGGNIDYYHSKSAPKVMKLKKSDLSIDPDFEVDMLINSHLQLFGDDLYVSGEWNPEDLERKGLFTLDPFSGQPKNWQLSGLEGERWFIHEFLVTENEVFVSGYIDSLVPPFGLKSSMFLRKADLQSGILSSWAPKPDGSVRTMFLKDQQLFVGGDFQVFVETSRRNLLQVDLQSNTITDWSPDPDGKINALSYQENTLFAGGLFNSIAGDSRSSLAAFQTSSGELLPWRSDVDGEVRSIHPFGNSLFLGGLFKEVSGKARSNLAKVAFEDGSLQEWSAGTDSTVHEIMVDGEWAYAGGAFLNANGTSRAYAAAFDAVSGNLAPWQPSPDRVVYALAAGTESIYLGGGFKQLSGLARSGIGEVDKEFGQPTSWNVMISHEVHDILLRPDVVLAGGIFSRVGSVPVNGFAFLNRITGENPEGLPAIGPVYSIWNKGNKLILGGDFNQVTDQSQNYQVALVQSGVAMLNLPDITDSPECLIGAVEVGEINCDGQILSIDLKFTVQNGSGNYGIYNARTDALIFSLSDQPLEGEVLVTLQDEDSYEDVSVEWYIRDAAIPECHSPAVTIDLLDCTVIIEEESFCINANSLEEYLASDGRLFLPDAYYSGSKGITYLSEDIEQTDDDLLYQTARQARDFTYSIPVLESAVYQVDLYFAELEFDRGGFRRFSVDAEGRTVLNDYDIILAAKTLGSEDGAHYAVVETFTATVADGNLDLEFYLGPQGKNRPQINAICLTPIEPIPACEISNLELGEIACDGLGATFELGFSVANGSGDYEVLDAQNGNVLASHSGAAMDGEVAIRVSIPGPHASGTVEVLVRDSDLGRSCGSAATLVATYPSCPENLVDDALCIDANGLSPYLDTEGRVFFPDRFFDGGGTRRNNSSIGQTEDDALYQSERFGKNFAYRIPIPAPGTYMVDLHFAETQFDRTGFRRFSVEAEGEVLINDYDIYHQALLSSAGFTGKDIAMVETIEATVTDGTLDLEFFLGPNGKNRPKVNAICVRPVDGLFEHINAYWSIDQVLGDTLVDQPVSKWLFSNDDYQSKIEGGDDALLELRQNYPNPFQNKTRIEFYLPTAGDASFHFFDALGRLVYRIEGNYAGGWNAIEINRKSFQTTGLIICQLVKGDQVRSKRMILME